MNNAKVGRHNLSSADVLAARASGEVETAAVPIGHAGPPRPRAAKPAAKRPAAPVRKPATKPRCEVCLARAESVRSEIVAPRSSKTRLALVRAGVRDPRVTLFVCDRCRGDAARLEVVVLERLHQRLERRP